MNANANQSKKGVFIQKCLGTGRKIVKSDDNMIKVYYD